MRSYLTDKLGTITSKVTDGAISTYDLAAVKNAENKMAAVLTRAAGHGVSYATSGFINPADFSNAKAAFVNEDGTKKKINDAISDAVASVLKNKNLTSLAGLAAMTAMPALAPVALAAVIILPRVSARDISNALSRRRTKKQPPEPGDSPPAQDRPTGQTNQQPIQENKDQDEEESERQEDEKEKQDTESEQQEDEEKSEEEKAEDEKDSEEEEKEIEEEQSSDTDTDSESQEDATLEGSKDAPFDVPKEEALGQEALGNAPQSSQGDKKDSQTQEEEQAPQQDPQQNQQPQNEAGALTQGFNTLIRNRRAIKKLTQKIKRQTKIAKRLQKKINKVNRKIAPINALKRAAQLGKTVMLIIVLLMGFIILLSMATLIFFLPPVGAALTSIETFLWRIHSGFKRLIRTLNDRLKPLKKLRSSLRKRMMASKVEIRRAVKRIHYLRNQGLSQKSNTKPS